MMRPRRMHRTMCNWKGPDVPIAFTQIPEETIVSGVYYEIDFPLPRQTNDSNPPAGQWLIAGEWTGSPGPVRIGAPGVSWSTVTMPDAVWGGADNGQAGNPAVIISDGGAGLYIASSFYRYSIEFPLSLNANALFTANLGTGTTWTPLASPGLLGFCPDYGDYLLGKYVIGYTWMDGYTFNVSANGTTWQAQEVGNPADVFTTGGICLHQGYAYVTVWEYLTNDVVTYRSATLEPDSWALVGRAADAWDDALYFPYYAHIVSTGTRLVILTGTGRLSYSDDDGATWPAATQTPMSQVCRFVYGNGIYAAISGADGSIWLAGSDLVFTAYTPAAAVTGFTKFRSIAFGNGKFVAVGDAGVVVEVEINPSTGVPTFTVIDAGFDSNATLIGVAYLG
jgi:hypothetical protein